MNIIPDAVSKTSGSIACRCRLKVASSLFRPATVALESYEQLVGNALLRLLRQSKDAEEEGAVRTIKIGEVTIDAVIEREGPWRRPQDFFPAYDAIRTRTFYAFVSAVPANDYTPLQVQLRFRGRCLRRHRSLMAVLSEMSVRGQPSRRHVPGLRPAARPSVQQE